MKKVRCCECGKSREPYRATIRLLDGSVEVVCRACWRDHGYDGIMDAEMSDDDRAALRRMTR